jgi:hypothetical protein
MTPGVKMNPMRLEPTSFRARSLGPVHLKRQTPTMEAPMAPMRHQMRSLLSSMILIRTGGRVLSVSVGADSRLRWTSAATWFMATDSGTMMAAMAVMKVPTKAKHRITYSEILSCMAWECGGWCAVLRRRGRAAVFMAVWGRGLFCLG